MSLLDQAFIRAYEAETGRRDEVGAAKPAASPAALRKAKPVDARQRRHYVDPPHAATAVPHYSDDATASGIEAGSVEDHVAQLAHRLASFNVATSSHGKSHVAQSHVAQSHGVHATTAHANAMAASLAEAVAAADDELDEATDEAEAYRTLPARPEQGGLHPAFETQRFVWPRNVEVLVAAAGSEFSDLAAELEARSHEGRKTFVVSGSHRGEGRTTLVLALARLAANRGLRTVVVDLDLHSPQAAELLGLRPEVGWDDVIADRLLLTDALIESLDDRLTLLPLRNGFANPRALAGNGFLRGALDTLREHFDIVLLDVGPLAEDADTIDLAAALGGCKLDDGLIVRDRRRATPKQVHDASRRMAALGVRHWDVVENFTEIRGYDDL